MQEQLYTALCRTLSILPMSKCQAVTWYCFGRAAYGQSKCKIFMMTVVHHYFNVMHTKVTWQHCSRQYCGDDEILSLACKCTKRTPNLLLEHTLTFFSNFYTSVFLNARHYVTMDIFARLIFHNIGKKNLVLILI